MKFFDWLGRKLNPPEGVKEIDLSAYRDEAADAVLLDVYAMFTAVQLIANLLSGCEFRTFYGGKERKGAEWAALNFRPNRNQNGAEFKHELTSRLLLSGEVLCVKLRDGQYIIADGFNIETRTLYDSVFSQVSKDGFTFDNTWYSGDVIYLKSAANAKQAWLRSVMQVYNKLLSSSSERFQNADGERGILTVSAMAQGAQDFEQKFDKLMNDYFKKYFKSRNAVLPLFDGYSYEVKNASRTGQYTNDLSAVKTLADEAIGRAGQLFGIPPSYIRGEAAEILEAQTAALTNCIKPLAVQIGAELTAKLFSLDEICGGSYVQVDTGGIIHRDLIGSAQAVTQLAGAGFSGDELRKAIGQPATCEKWAQERFMNRSFGEIKSVIAEGGEENGQQN